MKLRNALLAGLAVGVVSGCYGDSDAFWHKSAKLTCETQLECNKSSFENQFSSMEDCIETTANNGIDFTSTCEYDAEQARECISVAKKYAKVCDLNAAELDEISRACEDVHFSCL